jgi:hypothetical protein
MDLKKEEIVAYYSRGDIQEEIFRESKDREIAVRYAEGGFGKRPDILQFKNDVMELAKQGVSSFHMSEERWNNPLDLKTGMNRKQLDELRKGWDLVFDIDSPSVEFSKIVAELLIDSLKFNDVESIGCKYSGNKGFHLVVPFESMPETINQKETRTLFPELARTITAYLIGMIEEPIKQKIEELNLDIDLEDLLKVDIVLISSRHMFRAPYSIHEKSGLASIPLELDKVSGFKKEQAKLENVNTDTKFTKEDITRNEARKLIMQAHDWESRNKRIIEAPEKEMAEFQELDYKVDEQFFPPCIKKGLEGLEDGKKRFLFILLNFLKSCKWKDEEIEKRVKEWNKVNSEELQETYLLSQLSWNKRQKETRMPPNCSNIAYYKDLRLCLKDNFCQKIKNPVNYAIRRSRFGRKKTKKQAK